LMHPYLEIDEILKLGVDPDWAPLVAELERISAKQPSDPDYEEDAREGGEVELGRFLDRMEEYPEQEQWAFWREWKRYSRMMAPSTWPGQVPPGWERVKEEG
jgi:hypothetical protein